MMRKLLAVVVAAVALALLPAAAASAHPLGNFTINTADQVVVTAAGIDVLHVVDLAEIPTVQLRGKVSDAGGLTPYAASECARVAPLLDLVADGRQVSLSLRSSSGAVRPGAAGLTTTRLECRLLADVHPSSSISYVDGAVTDRVGWKEVTLANRCGSLRGADVAATSGSKLLTAYPADLLSSPLDIRQAHASVVSGPCTGDAGVSSTSVVDKALPRGVGGVTAFFTDFLGRRHLSLGFAIVSILASLAFGVIHALAPGHGKTVMAAYLVGQRGARRQALHLGSIVTFTHTASVLLLGALLTLGTLAAPERVVPLTEILSGLLLAGLGIYLLLLAVRRVRTHPDDHSATHDHPHPHPHDHDDPHPHPHPHDHDHDHPHPHEREHLHAELVSVGARAPQVELLHHVAPAVAPSRTSQQFDTRPARHPHVAGAAHSDVAGAAHSHAGGPVHSHSVPDGPLGWRTLAGMGVAGGLVPSPSALVVLLGATALGRAWFGVVLVVCYGLGMAVTLTAAGMLLLRAQAVLDRRGWTLGRGRDLARLLPLVTAAVVVVLGLGLVLRGWMTAHALA